MSIASHFDDMSYSDAPESDKEARAWLARHNADFGHFINGQFVAGTPPFESREPATGTLLARVAQGSPDDVDAAVQAARAAQPAWAALPGHQRARYLYAMARAVQRHARLFAVLESLDNGKPLRESRDIDVPLAVRHFYHHAGWAQLQDSEFSDHQPIGVIGQLIPSHFPLLMLARKVAPALALGNTVVLKPAELTPLSALLFAEVCQQFGLPAGVFNLVNGDGATGAALVGHVGVDKIAFTGSTEVGRSIRRQIAGSGKSLTLELGGQSPFIVFDDADQDAAIEGVVDAIWFNPGQAFCAGSRLLLQEGMAPAFLTKLRARMDKLRLGPPLDKSIDMAALCDVHPASTAAREEIFAPVLVSMTFRTPDEAVALANNTRDGLAASVWSENISRALDVASRIQAGVVWVNASSLFDAAVGFGGYREPGDGREGGRAGAYDHLKPRVWSHKTQRHIAAAVAPNDQQALDAGLSIDKTSKLYIGGKQTRPDGNDSITVLSPQGVRVGEVGAGNRKDIRNAVAAAGAASGWSSATAHQRAQVLYFMAENLMARRQEFASNLARYTDCSAPDALAEVDASLARLFSYGAWADKYEGTVHTPLLRGVVLAVHEPMGVVGVICPPEIPLLSFVSLTAPLIAMGNRVVAIPSESQPLSATDFYQVLETSDLPGGVLNIVTGASAEMTQVLAEHDDVDALWVFHSEELSRLAETLSVGNLKRTLVDYGRATDWHSPSSEGRIWLRHAVQVKNIWIPYGD